MEIVEQITTDESPENEVIAARLHELDSELADTRRHIEAMNGEKESSQVSENDTPKIRDARERRLAAIEKALVTLAATEERLLIERNHLCNAKPEQSSHELTQLISESEAEEAKLCAELENINREIAKIRRDTEEATTKQHALEVTIADNWNKSTNQQETLYGQLTARLKASVIVLERLRHQRALTELHLNGTKFNIAYYAHQVRMNEKDTAYSELQSARKSLEDAQNRFEEAERQTRITDSVIEQIRDQHRKLGGNPLNLELGWPGILTPKIAFFS